jgi:hypothetical protein
MSFLRDLVGDKGGEGGDSSNPLANVIRDFENTSINREIEDQIRPTGHDSASFSNTQKMKIRQRSEVMARQFFPDKGDEFIDHQVREFQKSLNIDDGLVFSRGMGDSDRGMYDSSTFGYVHPFRTMY